jgi:hypothetical protein
VTFRELVTATGLPERDFRAIKAFLVRSTVPLIFEADDVSGVQGSGCLFDLDGCLFFVTAGHVLKDVDPQKLGVPFRIYGSEIFTLGTGLVGWSQIEAFDIAAYRVDDKDTAIALRESFLVLGPANVGAPLPDSDHYVVVGYPGETVKKNGRELRPSDLTQLHTSSYWGDVIGPRGEHDLFLKLRRHSHSLWGQVTVVPDLRGLSGGPVWQVCESTTSIWTPESALRLVGLQVSCDPGGARYMRILRWEVVEAVLRKLDPAPSSSDAGRGACR